MREKILFIVLLVAIIADLKLAFGYIKSKQIDCGYVEVVEEEFSLVNNNNKSPHKVLISNLSECLRNLNEYNYTSFSAFQGSKEAAKIFEAYFDLDASSGLVFQKRRIDRESLCAETSRARIDPYSSTLDTYTTVTTINCDCRSEKCELGFKFIGFKEKSSPSLSSLGKRRRIQHHFQSNPQEYKYLDLSVHVKDLNDHRPRFHRSFLYLNTSEQFGKEPISLSNASKNQSSNIECASLKFNEKSGGGDLNLNSLVSLEKAYDLDVGKNSLIKYKLVLLRNDSARLIDDLEAELDDEVRLRRVREFVAGGNGAIRPCLGLFELAENVRLSDDFYNEDESGGKPMKKLVGGILKEQLFLKINTYLDREIQQVYNFILIASEATSETTETMGKPSNNKQQQKEPVINKDNFMLIRLLVTDLNDHQPKFNEPKYTFHMSEITEFKAHYSKHVQNLLLNEKNSSFYYTTLLNESCHRLKDLVKVSAQDADEGLSALVKYKITQKNHLKNPNNVNKLASSSFQMLKDDVRIRHGSEINSNDMFYINEQTGEIYLLVCKLIEEGRLNKNEIDREKFIELTSLLDYESYIKHILVIEASDSNPSTPLQSVVTLEINLSDLNDHRPKLVDLYSKECSSSAKFMVIDPSIYSPSSASLSSSQESLLSNQLNITIDSSSQGDRTRVIIRGLAENTPSGRCLGQFSINDLDTPFQNRRLEATLRRKSGSNSDNTGFIFTNVKTRGEMVFRLHHPNDVEYYEIEHHSVSNIGGRNLSMLSAAQTNEIFELYLNFEPDAELQSVHELDLELRDSAHPLSLSSHVDLVVYIDDINDNVPKFDKSAYNFSIDEWNELELSSAIVKKTVEQLPTSVCLGKIEASDDDVTQENSAISYSLVETEFNAVSYRFKKKRNNEENNVVNANSSSDGNESNFYVNANTGHICVKNPRLLDREKKSRYELIIKASNKNPSIYSTVPCHISIRDVNDNRPEFLQSEYRFYVAEKDSNLVVSNIILDDASTRSPYSIIDGSRRRLGGGSNRHGSSKRAFAMTYVGSVRAIDRDATSELVYYLDAANSQSYIELNTAASGINPSSPIDTTSEIYLGEEATAASSLDNNVYDFSVDAEFSDSSIYEVTAIKGTISEQQNSSAFSTWSSSNDEQDNQNQNAFALNYTNLKDFIGRRKKELKLIENISEYIYVNSTTGAIYLRKNIDREKILNLRFTLFVRDRKIPSSGALSNQVEVIIEIIDINDSKPECFSTSSISTNNRQTLAGDTIESTVEIIGGGTGSSSEEKLLIDVFSVRIDLDKIASFVSPNQYRLAKIYKFTCIDNDLNKNARLKYEIKNYYLRKLDDNKIEESTTTTMITKRKTKSPGNDEIEQLMSTKKIFTIDANSGVLLLNLTAEWSSWESDLIKTFLALLEKKFLVIRVRVSDHGIVPLFRDYFLRFYFCLADFGDRDLSDRLCDFGSQRRNRTILIKPLSFESINRQLNSEDNPWYEAANNDDDENDDEESASTQSEMINDSRDVVYDDESFGQGIAKTEIFNNDDQNSAASNHVVFDYRFVYYLFSSLLVVFLRF